MLKNHNPLDLRLAYTVDDFSRLHNIGKTSIYKEIQLGRLEAVKVGSRTLISSNAAARWLSTLPRLKTR